jgi:hypothetical protein
VVFQGAALHSPEIIWSGRSGLPGQARRARAKHERGLGYDCGRTQEKGASLGDEAPILRTYRGERCAPTAARGKGRPLRQRM